MADKELRTLAEWVEYTKGMLGLADWRVAVDWQELPPNCFARIVCAYARREATIILGDAYLKSTPESQRETLIHELLHCHFITLDEFMDDTIEPIVGNTTWSAIEASFDLFEERAIDAVAVAIADMGTIPLPPEEG